MGTICTPDSAFDSRTWRNGMRPEYIHFRAIDASQDRLGTAARRLAVPMGLGRGANDSYWSGATDWKHTITIPAYTRGVCVGALAKVQNAANKALNAVLYWGPDGVDWDHYLTFTQESQGRPASVYSDDSKALKLPWVWTNEANVVAQPDSPMAVTISNEPQSVDLYFKCASTLTYQILELMIYLAPYHNAAWPALP